MKSADLSHHAATRVQQRGFSDSLIELVLDHHDIDFYAGDVCRVLRVSRRHAEHGSIPYLSKYVAEKLHHLVVVWSDDTARIVTILHMKLGRQGRRYRQCRN
ncbi:DUF4258 domain-containing protein [Rhizobium sp. P38BS-XIX]|uniref:DUF4258 domain-containing protein n=1 Tax=Rhizobium sp. P38BS-XIX TaxID=2726740 RepID=UPI001456BA97|nr:DUF4258 domain-containing protein [Rhizobium sp. P38BS-XIX]NLR99914.1 DUF4258 domain-containing protein [Rhizobium sp. P38BS-XIX]